MYYIFVQYDRLVKDAELDLVVVSASTQSAAERLIVEEARHDIGEWDIHTTHNLVCSVDGLIFIHWLMLHPAIHVQCINNLAAGD